MVITNSHRFWFLGSVFAYLPTAESYSKPQIVPHVPHRPDQVRIVGHYDRLLVLPVEPVHQ